MSLAEISMLRWMNSKYDKERIMNEYLTEIWHSFKQGEMRANSSRRFGDEQQRQMYMPRGIKLWFGPGLRRNRNKN